MLTGDHRGGSHSPRAGRDGFQAELLPTTKVAEIRRRLQAGQVVAMVGDGVNDAPALAQADVGIALGGGTDVAVEASDLTLVGGDPGGVADAVALSRETYATIKQNLFWAFAYNVAAIPLAALGRLHPMVAAAAMSLSSVFVVGCSLQLALLLPGPPGWPPGPGASPWPAWPWSPWWPRSPSPPASPQPGRRPPRTSAGHTVHQEQP